MEISDDNIFSIEKLRKYSTDDIGLNEPSLRKRTLSIVMDRINHIGNSNYYFRFLIFLLLNNSLKLVR